MLPAIYRIYNPKVKASQFIKYVRLVTYINITLKIIKGSKNISQLLNLLINPSNTPNAIAGMVA
jgi:hypothetical protein